MRTIGSITTPRAEGRCIICCLRVGSPVQFCRRYRNNTTASSPHGAASSPWSDFLVPALHACRPSIPSPRLTATPSPRRLFASGGCGCATLSVPTTMSAESASAVCAPVHVVEGRILLLCVGYCQVPQARTCRACVGYAALGFGVEGGTERGGCGAVRVKSGSGASKFSLISTSSFFLSKFAKFLS